jgi:Putative peptidoglycan binding domain
VSRRALLPLAAVAAVAAVGGAVWAVAGAESGSAQADDSTSTATATVERRDLVQRETVSGTLGYADALTLYAQAPGTVTGLPEPGSVVERGEPLYRLDGKPVTLMYGDVPMWRPLDARSEDGPDIEQLERNLVELGYDPYGAISVDEAWGDGTTAAVERWQDDLGLPATVAVQLGQIVFLPGARRIGDAKATRGAPLQPGAEVLETSSTRRIVTVDLDADDQTVVSKGDPVRVELPDGRTVAGTVSSVGRVAESEVDPASGQELDPTVLVEIRLSPGAKPGSLDQAPVDVSLEKERVENALTVPVGALLALVEGGYAVEVIGAGGTTQLVRVEPGAFVDGTVEITGKGIEKGMKVVVPS